MADGDAPRRSPRDAARIVFARAIERVPRLYTAWAAHHGWDGVEYRPDTTLVVEGFPGSANSYLRAWIHWANGGHITSHQHSPAVIRRAMADGRPLLVLARNPVDAVASAILRFPEMAAWPEGPKRMLARYTHTYRPVLARPERAVVATFEQATKDPAGVLERVNRRFGTSFVPLPPEHDHEVMAYLDTVSTRADTSPFGSSAPTAARTEASVDLRSKLAGGPYARVRERADATYDALSALAERPS